MELSDYINLTLEEIARGIKKADATYRQIGGKVLTETTSTIEGIPHTAEMINNKPCYRPIVNVHFRVNVQMQESSESNTGIQGSLKVVSADATTKEGNASTRCEELSFYVPLLLPHEKK